MKHFLYFIFLLLVGGVVHAQQRFTLSGSVKAQRSGETIINASIKSLNTSDGVSSNEYGFYSLTLPSGNYEIEYSAIGFQSVKEQINLSENTIKNISLPDENGELDSVSVSANFKGRTITGTQMGTERITVAQIKNIPMLLGERDIIKAIQLLPGIKSASEGGSGFYVRGGSSDQNLILLDEAPVYNASHLMGFFSTFNVDAIKDVTVYKGGMPAQYGGRLSSVLDVKMNDGNNQYFQGSASIGLISAKATLEGPLFKDKSSFLISARRTYADLFVGLSKDSGIRNNKLYFYDLNTKLNYDLGKKDKLFLSGYFGRDNMSLDKQFGLDWGNATGTLRWNHIFNERLFSNTSLIYSNFNYNININTGSNDAHIFSQINDLNLKQEFQWFTGNKHNLRLGFNLIHHKIRPGEVTSSGETSYNDLYLQKRYSWDNAVFASDIWRVNRWLNLSYGLRVSMFNIYGPGSFYSLDANGNVVDTLRYKNGGLVKTYANAEPRVATTFILSPTTSIKAGYVCNVQNLHLIANSSTSFPTDKWVASTNIIKPEISDLFSIGWYKNLKGNKYELTVETYYKSMSNQIDYKTGADVYTNDAIESQLLFGIGRAYGLELLMKKKFGKLTGWLSYTLSKTERKIDGINDGQWYNARQDRTHDIAIVGIYELNKKWTVSANWVFYTGDAVTYPAGKYVVNNQIAYYYTKRNAQRMPNYHRLDFGINHKMKQWFNGMVDPELSFGMYNAYGRQNAYVINFRQSEDDPNRIEAVQTALFRFIPYVSLNVKF